MFRPECAHQQGGLRNLRYGVCSQWGVPQNYVGIHNNQSLSSASSMGECLIGLLDPGDSVCPTYALSSVSASQSGVGLRVSQSAAASCGLLDSPMGGIPMSTALGSVWVS